MRMLIISTDNRQALNEAQRLARVFHVPTTKAELDRARESRAKGAMTREDSLLMTLPLKEILGGKGKSSTTASGTELLKVPSFKLEDTIYGYMVARLSADPTIRWEAREVVNTTDTTFGGGR